MSESGINHDLQPKKDLRNLADVEQVIEQNFGAFYGKLKENSLRMNAGWQRIRSDGEKWEARVQPGVNIYPDTQFTGKDLCWYASSVLADAISNLSPTAQVQVVELFTDARREQWNNAEHEYKTIPHAVVKVTDPDTGKSKYYDSTPRQIDVNHPEQLLIVDEAYVGNFYSSGPNSSLEERDITSEKQNRIKGYIKSPYESSPEEVNINDYNALVTSLSK
jgi:hypothetical protein